MRLLKVLKEVFMNYKLMIVFLFLFVGLTTSGFAEVSADIRDLETQKVALDNEVKKMGAQVKETEKLIKEDATRYATLEKRYRDDLTRRSSELDSLNVKIKKIAEQLQLEKNKQINAKNRTERVKSKRKAALGLMMESCKALEVQVEQSIPWDKEARLERVRSLLRDLQTENASEEEAFSRMKSLIQEEIRFGDEVAILNAPFTRKNGETINAKILRIGNQWMVYTDENATVYGALMRKLESGKVVYEWNESLTLSEREAVKLAIDVKQARKAPQMVTLPLSLSVQREGK